MSTAYVTLMAVKPEWLVFFATVIVALAGVAGTLGGAWISKQSANRTAEIEKRRVTLDEFEQHKTFMKEQIAEQTAKVTEQLSLIQNQALSMQEQQHTITELKNGVNSLKYAVAIESYHRKEADRRVAQLIAVMEDANLEVPEALPPAVFPTYPIA